MKNAQTPIRFFACIIFDELRDEDDEDSDIELAEISKSSFNKLVKEGYKFETEHLTIFQNGINEIHKTIDPQSVVEEYLVNIVS